MSAANELGDVRDALAGIAAVAALLAGAQPAEVDRTAIARLIQLKAECAVLRLEELTRLGRNAAD